MHKRVLEPRIIKLTAARGTAGAVVALSLSAAILTSASARAAEILAQVHDSAGQPVADAVVIALPVDGSIRLATPSAPAEVEQVNKQFRPPVMAIQAGTSISFPNRDSVRHHVYSFSAAKRFELPLYSGTPSRPILFDKPGVVTLGCNIHDWMVGYIYVSESPYFARTDATGTALIDHLPAVKYNVRIWHAQLDGDENATRKPADLSASLRAELSWSVRLKNQPSIRRAPSGGSGGGGY